MYKYKKYIYLKNKIYSYIIYKATKKTKYESKKLR